jgi:hypothetical protein
MLDSIRSDLEAAANEGRAEMLPVTAKDVYDAATAKGCSISSNNMHKWLCLRGEIHKAYLGRQKDAERQKGGGRQPSFSKSETVVRETIIEKRASSFRVSVSSVKKLLREQIAEDAKTDARVLAELEKFKFSKVRMIIATFVDSILRDFVCSTTSKLLSSEWAF